MDDLYSRALIIWAHEYNGYDRIAQSPEHLGRVLTPLMDEYEQTGVVPEWAGTDLLRGWAFFAARRARYHDEPGAPVEVELIAQTLRTREQPPEHMPPPTTHEALSSWLQERD